MSAHDDDAGSAAKRAKTMSTPSPVKAKRQSVHHQHRHDHLLQQHSVGYDESMSPPVGHEYLRT